MADDIRATRRHSHHKHPISISLGGGSSVRYKHPIHGTVRHAGGPPKIQVLVYSNDGLWYPQAPVNVDGDRWSVEACFGFEDSAGEQFQVAAVCSDVLITEPVKELPSDLPLAVVNVVRA